MKKGIWVLIVFLLVASSVSVYASSGYFSVKSTAVDNRIMINEDAVFEITIYNNLGSDESFRIYYTDVEWGFSTEPITDSTVFIPDKGEKTVRVVLKPLYVGYGSHGISINVKSVNTDKLIRHPVLVSIISLGQWSPGNPIAVRTEIDMSRQINPKEPFDINIGLENQYAINVSDVTLRVKSSLFEVKKDLKLTPLERKTVNFKINLDPSTPPQKNTVLFTLTSRNQTFKEVEKEIEIVPYANLVKEELGPFKSFLRNDWIINVKNTGNAKLEQKLTTDSPSFTLFNLFTKPKAKIALEGSNKYIVWELALEPNETATIKMTESYRPLLSVILIVLLSLILYYVYRSPIVLKKESTQIKVEEGGLSQIKIMIHLKNRTSGKIKNVKILDRVPNLADISKTFKLGSLQPVKILKHDKKGSIAKWFINELEPYEERIIVYTIRARLTILGGFELPPAISKFRDPRGRDRKTSSNKVVVRV